MDARRPRFLYRDRRRPLRPQVRSPHGEVAVRCPRRPDRVHATGQFRHGLAEPPRSEEHTSELQSLMRISYAVFCLNKKKQYTLIQNTTSTRRTMITKPITH